MSQIPGRIPTLFSIHNLYSRTFILSFDPSASEVADKATKFIFNVLSLRKWTDCFERSGFRTLKTEDNDAATISHHYDICNDFYSLFLYPLMVYSFAIFDDHHGVDSLEAAQRNKVEVLYRKMESELDRKQPKSSISKSGSKLEGTSNSEAEKGRILEILIYF